ncbi:hypothetical protein QE152_g675 [Popillia japonica]|uniref:SCAN domain-containing protein 3 n=1 Tax=Popillia japonica TaxID=7064 RepID=A0AAW1NCM6_POPJA
MKLDSSGRFGMENETAVQASYKIFLFIAKDKKPHGIAKDKKPHGIGESLIKPCLLTPCSNVLGKDGYNKVVNISLLNDIVKRRIDDMAIETTMKQQTFQNKRSCCFTVDTTAVAVDIFSALQTFLEANDLPCERVIRICTNGAHAMTGCRSGFIELAKKKNPKAIGSHCIIHRQALACQSFPESLNTVLNLAVKVVNHVKSSALNSRLFLNTVLNLAVKVVNHVKSSALNSRLFRVLYQELKSDQETVLFHTEICWLSKEDGSLATPPPEFGAEFSFLSKLNNILDDTQSLPEDLVNEMKDLKSEHLLSLKNKIGEMKDLKSEHLLSLKNKIGAYFPDISSENWEFKLTRDPFQINVDILPNHKREKLGIQVNKRPLSNQR